MVKNKFIKSDALYSLITGKYWNTILLFLKNGTSPSKISKWLATKDVEIGTHSIQKLILAYKKSIAEKTSIENYIVPSTVMSVKDIQQLMENKATVLEEVHKVKNDREVLDKIIQKGYNNLNKMKDEEITLEVMFKTIELKERITSCHNTVYGDQVYQELELGKYALIIQELMKFIPPQQQELALQKIQLVETQYYKDKGFYEEYLQSRQNVLTMKECEIDE